ncbi:hypothetical protein [Planotetraspora mira]
MTSFTGSWAGSVGLNGLGGERPFHQSWRRWWLIARLSASRASVFGVRDFALDGSIVSSDSGFSRVIRVRAGDTTMIHLAGVRSLVAETGDDPAAAAVPIEWLRTAARLVSRAQ